MMVETESPIGVRWPWSKWRPSPVFIAVARCSIAYLLASLFTFVPFLARLLTTTYEEDVHGRISRKPAFAAHMVATIVVYVRDANKFKLPTVVADWVADTNYSSIPPSQPVT
jgi:hypothetical protein